MRRDTIQKFFLFAGLVVILFSVYALMNLGKFDAGDEQSEIVRGKSYVNETGDNISDSLQKCVGVECYHDREPLICDEVNDEYKAIECKDNFYLEQKINYNDYSFCYYIIDNFTKTRCLEDLG